MDDLRRWCRRAGWLCVLAIVVLSLLPGTGRPQSGIASGPVEHLFAYLAAAALFALGAARLGMLTGLVALAALLETLQLWVPGRNAELAGFAGSAAGAILGWAAGRFAALGLRWAVRRRAG